MPELCLPESKASSKLPHNLLATERRPTVGDMMSCEDFSSLQRLLRVTTYVDPASRLIGKSDSNFPIALTPQEFATTEKLWITQVQKELVLQKDFDALKPQFGLFLNDCGDVVAGYRMPTFILQL